MFEADDDVGDLHARVVDVVLDLDMACRRLQNADECVADRRIAKVADMRRFVRIDVRVLDDDLTGLRRRCAQLGCRERPWRDPDRN